MKERPGPPKGGPGPILSFIYHNSERLNFEGTPALRVHRLLLGTGWRVNFKRVHRLWKQEHLQVLVKQQKRRRLPGKSENGCVRHRATHRNHVWSYDFLVDRTD